MKLRLRALTRTTHFVEDGQNMTGEVMPTLTAGKNIFKLISDTVLKISLYRQNMYDS